MLNSQVKEQLEIQLVLTVALTVISSAPISNNFYRQEGFTALLLLLL